MLTELAFRALLAAPVVALVAIISYRLRTLSMSGAIAAFLTGVIVFTIGGLSACVALVVFFVVGSALSKLPSDTKHSAELIKQRKESERNWRQVAANGAVPIAALLLLAVRPALREELSMLYLGALATMFADTSATELGTRFGGQAYDVIRFRAIEKGESGGVTGIGLLASVAAPSVIALMHLTSRALGDLCEFQSMRWAPALIAGGAVGAFADSLLGASVQARYRCGTCEKIVEHRLHCDGETVLVRGIRGIENNAVNLTASAIGAGASLVLLQALN